jgi:hypothetical protein
MKADCLRLTNPQGMNSIIIFVHRPDEIKATKISLGRQRSRRAQRKTKTGKFFASQSEIQKACGQKISRNGFDFYLRIMGHGFSQIGTDFIFIHRRDRGGRWEKPNEILGWLRQIN